MRGSLVGIIYHKTLRLTSSSTKASAALTLMSADVDRIALTVEKIYEVWAGTIEVGIAVYLLERQIGWACIAPLILGASTKPYPPPLNGKRERHPTNNKKQSPSPATPPSQK